MNIVILIHSMHSGGAERVTANLTNEWAKRGWQVTVITLAPKSVDFYELRSDVSRIALDLATESPSILKALFSNLHRIIAIRRELRRLSPDIVLAMMIDSSILAILAGMRLGIPVIGTEHTYPPMNPTKLIWDRIRRWTYPYAARVVMLTSEGLSWLNDKIPNVHGAVIPNPVPYPLAVFEPKLLVESLVTADRKLLLAVGRMVESKQFDRLIEVFSMHVDLHQDWDLVILGDGPERQALKSQVQALGLETRIHLPGQAGNMGDWYQRADLYVMSSRYEGFPNTLTEAMAHGCAAVSYDCDTGPRDIIRHGVDGLLVSPVGDVPALAEALHQLMQDDEVRQRMRQRAIEVRERYSLKVILTLWDKLFNEAVPNLITKKRKLQG